MRVGWRVRGAVFEGRQVCVGIIQEFKEPFGPLDFVLSAFGRPCDPCPTFI